MSLDTGHSPDGAEQFELQRDELDPTTDTNTDHELREPGATERGLLAVVGDTITILDTERGGFSLTAASQMQTENGSMLVGPAHFVRYGYKASDMFFAGMPAETEARMPAETEAGSKQVFLFRPALNTRTLSLDWSHSEMLMFTADEVKVQHPKPETKRS